MWTIRNAGNLFEAAENVLVPHRDYLLHHPFNLKAAVLHVTVEEADQSHWGNFRIISTGVNNLYHIKPRLVEAGLADYFKRAVHDNYWHVVGTLKVVVELPSFPHDFLLIIREPLYRDYAESMHQSPRSIDWEETLQATTSRDPTHLPSTNTQDADEDSDDEYLHRHAPPQPRVPPSWIEKDDDFNEVTEEAREGNVVVEAEDSDGGMVGEPEDDDAADCLNDDVTMASDQEVELLMEVETPEPKCLNCALFATIKRLEFVCGRCRAARYCVSLISPLS